MRSIDSDALAPINRSLGIAGGTDASKASETQLDDETVVQVYDVIGAARRGRAPVGDGLFYLIIATIHVADAALTTDIDPYDAGIFAQNGYPAPVPDGFDLWLVSASLISSADIFQDCALALNVPATTNGIFVVNTDGVLTTATGAATHGLCLWSAESAPVDGIVFGVTGTGQINVPIGVRIRRGTLVRFISEVTAAAAHQNDLRLLFGIMPSTLGQDVAI